jgi:hypothetical protein
MHHGIGITSGGYPARDSSGRSVLSAQQVVDAVGIVYLAAALIDYALHGTHCMITSGVHKQVHPCSSVRSSTVADRRRARSRTCQTERPVPQGLYPLVDQTGGFAIRNHRGELLQGQEAEVYATTNDLHSLIKYSYELQGLARSFPRSPILAYDVKCSPLIMTSLRIASQCAHCRPALRICGTGS